MFNWSVLSIVVELLLVRGSDIDRHEDYSDGAVLWVYILIRGEIDRDIRGICIWGEIGWLCHFYVLLTGRCEDTSKQFIFEYIFLASY